MDRESIKELIPIMQAYVDGKVVQCKGNEVPEWTDRDTPNFLNCACLQWRIKPEPFECWVCIDDDGSNMKVYGSEQIVDKVGRRAIHMREVE